MAKRKIKSSKASKITGGDAPLMQLGLSSKPNSDIDPGATGTSAFSSQDFSESVTELSGNVDALLSLLQPVSQLVPSAIEQRASEASSHRSDQIFQAQKFNAIVKKPSTIQKAPQLAHSKLAAITGTPKYVLKKLIKNVSYHILIINSLMNSYIV